MLFFIFYPGQGIFCIDVKPWRGTVSAHNQNWHVQVKEEDQNFTNTRIEQTEDPLKAIMVKKKEKTHLSEMFKYHH